MAYPMPPGYPHMPIGMPPSYSPLPPPPPGPPGHYQHHMPPIPRQDPGVTSVGMTSVCAGGGHSIGTKNGSSDGYGQSYQMIRTGSDESGLTTTTMGSSSTSSSSSTTSSQQQRKRMRLTSEERLQRSRERNRVHARKTRKRKKVQMESIQVTIENLQEEGRRMRLAVTEWYTANILLVMRGPEAEKEEALKSEAPNHAPNSGPQCKGQPPGSAPAGSTTGANDGLLSKYMTVQSFLERTNAAVAANNKAYEEAQSRAASESGLMDDSSSLGDADEADEGKAGGARGRCKYAPEDRERIRRERNRIHAKRTRDRRKRFMEESEKVMTRLLKENEELRQMLDLIYGDHAPVAGNQPGRSHPPQHSHHLPPHPQLAQSFAQFPSNGQALYPAAPVPQGGASGEGSSVASSSTTISSASSQATGSVTMTTGKTPEGNSHHSGNGRAPRPEGARVGQEGGSQGSEQEGLGDEDEYDDDDEEEEEEDERAYKAPKQVSPRWSEVPPSQVGEHWATSRPHLAAPSHQSGLRSVPPYPLSFPPTSAGTTQNGAPTDVGTEYKVEGSSMMRAIAPMGVLSAPTADDESRCRSPLHQQPPMPSIPIQAGAESCDVLEAGSGRKGETKPEPPSMQAV